MHEHERDYPDTSLPGRIWNIVGSRFGEPTREFFNPDDLHRPDGSKRERSWLWVDEQIDDSSANILTDAHSPHEYSGYELHVRKQPVITTFETHDHLIIPDLDVETEGDQTVSIIVHTDFIWTRRSQQIDGFDRLLQSAELWKRGPVHDTAVYAFVGILRVLLEGLDHQLMFRERQTYAIEELFLGSTSVAERGGDNDPLDGFRDLPRSSMLVKLRIGVAGLRKQYDAFERVVNDLFDPAHGAFRREDAPVLEPEASPYFQHLSEQIKRALNKIRHLSDIHATLDQLLASHEAEKTNATLLRLTWISFVFLPIGFIASLWGMNISLFQGRHILGDDSLVALASLMVAFLTANLFVLQARRK